jgi:D-alanyl-D-alanine carboxypeptidase/D-alanyl-D-alanine-endopeptidase (penicillin-binding protein 4)
MPRLVLARKTRRVVASVALGLTLALGALASFGLGHVSANLSAQPPLPALDSTVRYEASAEGQRELPDDALAALRIPTCSLSDSLQDPALGDFSGVVLDPVTNEVLLDRDIDELLAPASVQKIVTAAAALTTLGPDTTFTTSTWSTDAPEVLVLKAGGDLTLSTTSEGSESVYVGAAKVQDLAIQTVEAWEAVAPEGERMSIRKVIIDASLWDAEDSWRESWSPTARTNGYMSKITPLQIDGDRFAPSAVMGQRSNDPMGRAASAFVSALRQAGNSSGFVSVEYASAPDTTEELASVSSPPVSDLVRYMLKESDNTLAEMLGRHISLSLGLDGSGDSVGEALLFSLAPYGIASAGVALDDASGLSRVNRVSPRFVASLIAEISRSSTELAGVMEGLPVSGVDGSLDDRFTGDNAIAQGTVRAKTGSIQGVRSLAGTLTATDGGDLVFAFFASGEVSDDARSALETAVVGVYRCGANLADF